MPTSRATRVTSSAKLESWSTIVLIVFFSSSTSPLTSTVIFFERSPFATAVVTSAMLRTWPVRFDAIWLTESVRSFHVPETPLTSRLAAELALGADLARDARDLVGEARELVDHRVHGRADAAELAADRLAVDLELDLLRRSPSATASITRATSIVGRARLSISSLTAPTFSAHEPGAPATPARSVIRPSRPTTLLTRTSSSRHLLVPLDERVERRGDVGERAVRAQADGEVAVARRPRAQFRSASRAASRFSAGGAVLGAGRAGVLPGGLRAHTTGRRWGHG